MLQTMSKRPPKNPLPGLLLLVLCVFCAGCYTMLQHPTGGSAELQYARYTEAKDCRDCHERFDTHHSWRLGNRWYSDFGSRRGYYRPWWYDDYWFWNQQYGQDPYQNDHDDYAPAPEGDWWNTRRKRGRDVVVPLQNPAQSSDGAQQSQDDDPGVNQGSVEDEDSDVEQQERKKKRRGKR